MNTDNLIELAQRKNAAHRALLAGRQRLRTPAGMNKMTERDRDIDMDGRTLELRETFENLCDEYAVRLIELQTKQ